MSDLKAAAQLVVDSASGQPVRHDIDAVVVSASAVAALRSVLAVSEEATKEVSHEVGRVKDAERHGYVLAMAIMQSPLWENADEDVRLAVSIFVASPIVRAAIRATPQEENR